jgi:hypothetical protein
MQKRIVRTREQGIRKQYRKRRKNGTGKKDTENVGK